MNPQALEEALAIKQRLIKGMLSYMEAGGADGEDDPDFDPEWDAGYQQEDVDECAQRLDDYQQAIEQSDGTPASIMSAIEQVVTALNELNQRCEQGLIETDQREDICAFIDAVIVAKGVDIDALAASQDCSRYELTDEWRDW